MNRHEYEEEVLPAPAHERREYRRSERRRIRHELSSVVLPLAGVVVVLALLLWRSS